MTQPKSPQQEFLFVRMNPDVYKQLEGELLSRCVVTDKTSAIEAGRIIGIQEALRYLRNGFTVPA